MENKPNMKKILKNEYYNDLLSKSGYTKINFLNYTEVDLLSRELVQIFAENLSNTASSYAYFSQTDDDIEKKRKAEKLINELFKSKIEEIFVDYEILGSWAIVKQPNGGYVGPHQHAPTTTDYKNK